MRESTQIKSVIFLAYNKRVELTINYFRAMHEISGGRVSTSKERTLNFSIARRKTG